VSELRHYEVAMSVEALASAWARTENAPDGSMLVADSEISGRLRGGTPWQTGGSEALIMAMIVRPSIDPLQEALLWSVASLGVADALTEVTGHNHAVTWPDTVVRVGGSGAGSPQSRVNVAVQLGPGRVEHAVLAVRTRLDAIHASKERLLAGLEHHLQAATRLVESDSLALLDAFNDGFSMINRRARVSLLPRGEARGRVTAVDRDGFLVLESSTGMLERIAPSSVRSIELVN